MNTYLMQCTPKTEVVENGNTVGYTFGKPMFYFTPQENAESDSEYYNFKILAEMPELDTWQIQKLNAVLKEI